MLLRIIASVVLIWPGLSVFTYSQSISSYRFKALTFQEGLSNAAVTDIIQDSLGYVWLGTENGLNRYDGSEVVVFKHTPDDTTSLPDNSIKKLFLDSQHRLWIITNSRVCRYRPERSGFRTYSLEAVATEGNTNAIDITETAAGQILLLSHLNKVSVLSEEQDRFDEFFTIASDELLHSLQLYGDRFFVGGRKSLLEVESATGAAKHCYSLEDTSSLMSSYVAQLTVIGKQLWIAGPGIHLHTLDLVSGSLRKVDILPPITSFAPLTDHTFFVGSSHGAYLYNWKQNRARSVVSADYPDMLKSTQHVFVDNDQNLWAVNQYKGVVHTAGKRVFHDARHLNSTLADRANEVSSVKAIDQQLWLGLNSGQAMTLNLSNGQLSPLVQTGSGTVFDITQDQRGRIWAGSYEGGLQQYDFRTKRFIYHNATIDSLRIRSNDIRNITVDEKGRLWLAVHGRGVDVYDPDQQRVVASYGESVGDTNPFFCDWTYQSVVTPSGVTWIASAWGLQMINEGREKSFYYQPQQAGSLSSNIISCLLYDRNGYLWVGTSAGLNVLNFEDSSFTTFTTQQGLNDNYIVSLVEDEAGRIWIGTHDGLAYLSYTDDPQEAKVQQVVLPPGQYSHQFLPRASTIDTTGNLYFATTHGLLAFNPKALSQKKKEPKVLLTSFAVLRGASDSNVSRASAVLSQPITSLPDRVQLEPNQNNLTIGFAAIDFVYFNPTTYSYRLKGHSDRWTTTTDRQVTYYDLPAGEYTFLVKTGASGNSRVAQLSFSVKHPWFRTIEGQLIISLLLLAAVALGVYELLERARLKNLAQLNRKEREIEQHKLKFFTNVSHELRTPLSLMLGPLEQLADSVSDSKGQRYLALLKRNTQQLNKLVNQLLDIRRIDQQHYQLRVSPGNLIGLVENAYWSFQPLAEQQAIDYQFENRTSVLTTTWFDADVLDKVLYNLLSNAFKYTVDGGSIRVTVEAHATRPDWITIEVSDTGIGIPTEQLDKIFERFYRIDTQHSPVGTGVGLSLCRELIRLHQGEIRVTSTPHGGSTFTVIVPIHADHYSVTSRHDYGEQPINDIKYISLDRHDAVTPEEGRKLAASGETNDRALVLVVDDNPDVLLFVQESMSDTFRIINAQNGQEAFEQAVNTIPDAIVSDVMMPVMDGLILTKQLKEDQRTSHIPIILLTARADDQHQVEGLRLTADDYITKPFKVALLTAKLQSLITNRNKLRTQFSGNDTLRLPQQISQNSEKKFLLKLTGIIEENLENAAFGTDDLCQAMGMSRSQLYRKLSAVTGKSVHEFIKLHRLARAAQLLHSGQHTIADVAHATGFKHNASFTRLFKKQYGCPPSQFAE